MVLAVSFRVVACEEVGEYEAVLEIVWHPGFAGPRVYEVEGPLEGFPVAMVQAGDGGMAQEVAGFVVVNDKEEALVEEELFDGGGVFPGNLFGDGLRHPFHKGQDGGFCRSVFLV